MEYSEISVWYKKAFWLHVDVMYFSLNNHQQVHEIFAVKKLLQLL